VSPSAAATQSARPVRTLLCTRGGLFGALVLARLSTCAQLEICGIVRSTRVFHPRYSLLRGAAAYLRRSGFFYTLYLLCATTLADVACSLGGRAVPTRSRGRIRVYSTRDLNDRNGLEFLEQCAPDLIVSAFFDQRLHARVLAIPEYGAINIHPSLLPHFRGVEPVLQAQLHGAGLGVSVHYMSAALDEGQILAQQRIATPARASLFALTAQLFDIGATLLVEVLECVRRGEPGIEQSAAGSYQSWPARAELRAFKHGGGALMRLSDWLCLLRPRIAAPCSAQPQPSVAQGRAQLPAQGRQTRHVEQFARRAVSPVDGRSRGRRRRHVRARG
jgi:methionyl-tRNA formyltransferase